METARWIIAGLLIALSSFFAVCQVVNIAAAHRRLRIDPNAGGYSMVPLVGGLLGMIGCLIAPHHSIDWLWWVPLIVDPGCGLLFGFMLFYGARDVSRRFHRPKR